MSEISEVISSLKERGIILNRETIEFITENKISQKDIDSMSLNALFLTKEFLEDKLKIDCQKIAAPDYADSTKKDEESEEIQVESTIQKFNAAKDYPHSVRIENIYCGEPMERNVDSFVEYFNARYNAVKNILSRRQELKNLISMSRINKYTTEKNISVIGIVCGISKSKSGNTIIELEDPSGKMNALLKDQKNGTETEIIVDEIIGVRGNISEGFMFAESIVFPDIPMPTGGSKTKDPVSAAFISDLHYGSKYFSKKIESKFLKWIKSHESSRIKYIFIAGDIVDGIGIYPSQEADLLVKDIYDQYSMFEEFIMKIPEHIQIIVCPGNHDAVRMAEPQPQLPKELLLRIHDMKNVYLTTNPSFVNIHEIDSQGINVLMYHGYSFTSIIDSVPSLRQAGLRNPQNVMEYILKRRHLAPTYGSTIISPDKNDSLVINKIPDIFHTGDLHSHAIAIYKGVTLISSSTFQNQTPFMDRVGHVANPGKVTIVDLDTRNTYCIDFNTD